MVCLASKNFIQAENAAARGKSDREFRGFNG